MNRMFPVSLRAAVAGSGLLLTPLALADDPARHGSPQAPDAPMSRRWADLAYPGSAPGGQPSQPAGQAPLPADTGAPPSRPGGPAPEAGTAEGPPSGQLRPAAPGMPTDTGAPPSPPTVPEAPGMGAEAAPSPYEGLPAPSALESAMAGAGAAAPAFGLGGGLATSGAGGLAMLGDELRVTQRVAPPRPPIVPPPGIPPVPGVPPGQVPGGFGIVASIRAPKICENQSPQPQDRIYYSFNYYEDVNRSINQRIGSSLFNTRVFRNIIGVEKTVLNQQGSIGLRLPINTLSTDAYSPILAGTSSAVGDLAVILKYAFLWDRDTGSLLSGGLMINTPTGPNRFANYPFIRSPHFLSLTPYLGYIYNFGDMYFHGFSSIDVPVNSADVTVLYNDLGLGYFLYRGDDPDAWLTAVVPTFETHINIPLNHDGGFDLNDVAWTPNVVNLTFGLNFGIGRRGLLSAGYVCPVTGPRPFDNEWVALFNLRF
jgi:hypothetical protein